VQIPVKTKQQESANAPSDSFNENTALSHPPGIRGLHFSYSERVPKRVNIETTSSHKVLLFCAVNQKEPGEQVYSMV
jgi:hypothetical protein